MDFSSTDVVHIVRQYAPNRGGLEDFVANLVARQNNRFASIKVVTLDRLFREPGTKLSHHEVIDGIEVHRIPFSGSSRYPIAPAVFRELQDVDLVHVHAVDFFFDALALSRIWHRKPLVATTHGGFFHTQNYAWLKFVWFNTLTRFSAHQYKGIACCSESDLQQFSRIAPHSVSLIENGVDLEKFPLASSEIPKKRLVTIGRMSKNKRLDRVLDVLACLNASNEAWCLDIIGGESDLTIYDLEGMVTDRSLDGMVKIHVGLDDYNVRNVLKDASIFVSASEYEGFGIALIEAMSAGFIPVVHPNDAFRVFAARHKEISLADFSAPHEVARIVRRSFTRLENTQALRKSVADASHAYGWPAAVDHYDELYAQALGL